MSMHPKVNSDVELESLSVTLDQLYGRSKPASSISED